MVAIEGRDLDGHPFRRLDPMLVLPISFRLDVPSMGGMNTTSTSKHSHVSVRHVRNADL